MTRTEPQALTFQHGIVHANGMDLFYEQFGIATDPAVLLLMGNSAPGLVWPDAFCSRLTFFGFRVIRFDQRDTGLSTYVDFASAPYTLDDLMNDAFALLNGLDIQRLRLAGLSQGGVLAYRMALKQPARVLSLAVLVLSADLRPKNDAFAGKPIREGELPRPSAEYVAAVRALNATPPLTQEDVATRFVDNFRLAKGTRSPFDEDAWRALGQAVAAVPRRRRDRLMPTMANNSNHARAQQASPTLLATELATLAQPVLIVHGGGDPIFPVAHARWAAAVLPNARLHIIEDMGHALDPAFFAPIVDALTSFWTNDVAASLSQ